MDYSNSQRAGVILYLTAFIFGAYLLLLEKGYKGVFESLPEEKQSILIGRKADFAERAGIDL